MMASRVNIPPHKIVLCVAYPYEKADFVQCLQRGDSDFIASMNLSHLSMEEAWRQYDLDIATGIRHCIEELKSRNVDVIPLYDVNDMSSAVGYDVVIILAHHSKIKDSVELLHGPVQVSLFASLFQPIKVCTIDITSCFSESLLHQTKLYDPSCRIRAIEAELPLSFTLYLIQKTIKLLAVDYSREYFETLKGFFIGFVKKSVGELDKSRIDKDSGICFVESFFCHDKLSKLSIGQATKFFKSKLKSLRSSVYAPKEVSSGDAFMVQLFIHKMKESSMVTITATSVDMTADLRQRKCLSFLLNGGDSIKARLEALFDKKKEFEIDESEKETIWNGEPVSLDYVVNVKEKCIAKAFRGRLRICVNSQPVGDILFNVFINNGISAHSYTRNDNFNIVPFDKRQEANEALKMVKGKLEEQISALEKYSNNDGQCTLANVNQELAISRLCLNLIKNCCSKTSPVKVVFISSTSDLKEYRDKVRKAIADCQMYPEMYEHWNQGDINPRDKCCEKVMSSDIFICILGANYGRIEPMLGISMTEMEYRVAQLSGKSILIYIDDQYLSKMELLKDEQLKQKQLSLINEIKEKRWVQFFDSPESLEKLVRKELLDVKKTLVCRKNF